MIYQFMLRIQYKTVYQEGPDLAVCLHGTHRLYATSQPLPAENYILKDLKYLKRFGAGIMVKPLFILIILGHSSDRLRIFRNQ